MWGVNQLFQDLQNEVSQSDSWKTWKDPEGDVNGGPKQKPIENDRFGCPFNCGKKDRLSPTLTDFFDIMDLQMLKTCVNQFKWLVTWAKRIKHPSIDWFKGKIMENPVCHGKIVGFRLRFSHEKSTHWIHSFGENFNTGFVLRNSGVYRKIPPL